MHVRLVKYLEENYLLGEFQAGFREGRSCSQQAFVLKMLMQKAKRDKNHLILSFLDVAKAFDSISHSVLLNKCCRIGLPAGLIRALIALLSNLKYFIKNNGPLSFDTNSPSGCFDAKRGSPQGGILSPLLYIIYALDIANETNLHKLGPSLEGIFIGNLMFADDMNLLAVGKTVAEAKSKAQKQLNLCMKWAEESRIQFNADKSIAMWIRSFWSQREGSISSETGE